MRFLIDKAKNLDIGWNERPLAEDDFYRLCKRFRISVEETPLHTRGFYFRLMGRDLIALDCRLSGAQRLAVMFHELAHFLFHVPQTGPVANFHHVGHRTRKEREADVFALCALIPKTLLETRSITELIYDGFPAEMIATRHDIYRQHSI